jgi:hypothetical protein
VKNYDVIIVGTGPAGIFAALELSGSRKDLRILMVEKGRDLDDRKCPMKVKSVSCAACPECAVVSGWGGAGAFSDGKLTLSPDIGGFLLDYIERDRLRELIDHADSVYVAHGAPKRVFGADRARIREFEALAARSDLELVPSMVRHIGTDRCRTVLRNMEKKLQGRRVEMRFGAAVASVITRDGAVRGVRLDDGTECEAGYVVLAPGREGSKWLERESRKLKLTTLTNPVDIGVRVEVPAAVLEHLTSVMYEPKLVFYSRMFDDKVRTFCVNPYGEVVLEHLKGLWTVNGHSYSRKKTENTNFALLVNKNFTEPFHEPITYGRSIAGLANILGGSVLVQRLGDLRAGRRSTPERISKGLVKPTLADATPGDLSFVLPYRYLADILEMLESLDRIAPGINSRHTLLYGIEVKFYSMKLKLTSALETEVPNLFAAGDGAGVSRGLIQASVSGVLAARAILGRIG